MINIISPTHGSTVSLQTAEQKNFIADTYKRETAKAESFDYLNLVAVAEDRTCPAPVRFSWYSDCVATEFTLEISQHEDFSEKLELRTSANEADIFNLLAGTKYYFRVKSDKDISAVCAFSTELSLPRCINIPGLINVRDAGGWQTASGRQIKQGLLYRGCKMELSKSGKPPVITEEGKEIMTGQLKIKTDLDLRFDSVGTRESSPLEDSGVRFLLLPCKSCEDFLEDDCAVSNRELFEALACEENYPIYMHCWGGADRTGTVMFFLGAILGMSQEDMWLDYEFTSLAIWGIRSRNGESIQNFKTVLSKFGADGSDWRTNAIRYLHSIGVTEETMDRIRKIFL